MYRYNIKKKIGQGKYGKVFLATMYLNEDIYEDDYEEDSYEDIYKKEEIVAIKVIKKEILEKNKIDPSLEISILTYLYSDYIIKLIDHFEDETNFYHVLEYIPQDLYSKIPSLNNQSSLSIFKQIINGIDYIHACNIMHRDIKPENILINKSNNAIICDFGFAINFKEGEKFYDFLGTVFYLAPEIISKEPYDYKIDIWALGILYFEMLSGYPPFFAEKDPEVYLKIMNGEIDFPYFFLSKDIKIISLILSDNPDYRPSLRDILNYCNE